MPEIRRSALMPYPARFMYDVVNNVDSYPDFLPWCGGVETHHVDETSMEASILMRGAGLNHWFKTRNSMLPGKSIAMELVEGPFKQLVGYWCFKELKGDACKVSLELEYEFSSRLLGVVVGPVFNQIANAMVDSFVDRAKAVYD